MKDLPIEAAIHETETGIFYQIKLHAIPRVGEFISLFSYAEQSAGKNSKKQYKVLQVIHQVRDVFDEAKISAGGHHSVRIFVKRAESPYFKETDI